ncbi:peptidoglycan DD-metalloendopeptidase family protein [Idiomarina xiamenensis]|uniref:M23/M37 family peptidase n=1 Tax=Idiomarina xiamenensis 10-D-4 TaxID=740709 RepID=K2LC84_9GAMM|nr:peptidoglycan DD-metalloendopeptidase family protein [Idiomarina xiamenensis]EKE87470.1 M23/M37 family peptidase [Idiomarina xiamenensis 10-D-4]
MTAVAKLTKQLLNQLPHSHKVLLTAVSTVLLILLLLPSEQATASKNVKSVEKLVLGKRYQLDLELADQPNNVAQEDSDLRWSSYTVKSGDSLARIFEKNELTPRQLYEVTEAGDDAAILRRIHPGEVLRFARNSDGDLLQLAYPINSTDTLLITRNNDKYVTEIESRDVETRSDFRHAVINSSFWNAGIDSGLTEGQIMSIANIFGWDIDFALDLRKGDEFSVLFEKQYIDGDFVGYGKILAAEFVSSGEKFTAVLHSNGQYYSPEGKAMRKTFLRSPVKFTYISSNFNPRRLHPVTGRVRPHNGIDYAAAVGTPVMSSGNGKVIASSYNKYNGNYVFIQHGERYVTKYLHLSKRLVKKGDRIKQGQLVGRVGATGRVTGAHLHYEFLVDGVHRNPRTVELPQAKSLDSDELPSFKLEAEQLLAALNSNKRVYLAMR